MARWQRHDYLLRHGVARKKAYEKIKKDGLNGVLEVLVNWILER